MPCFLFLGELIYPESVISFILTAWNCQKFYQNYAIPFFAFTVIC